MCFFEPPGPKSAAQLSTDLMAVFPGGGVRLPVLRDLWSGALLLACSHYNSVTAAERHYVVRTDRQTADLHFNERLPMAL